MFWNRLMYVLSRGIARRPRFQRLRITIPLPNLAPLPLVVPPANVELLVHGAKKLAEVRRHILSHAANASR